MRLIVSVQLKSSRDRENLLNEINLMGYVPRLKGETITIVVDGHFKGSFISLVGAMDGYEFTQEERENEAANDSQFSDGEGI